MLRSCASFFRSLLWMSAGFSLCLFSCPGFVGAGENEDQLLKEILQQLNQVNARFDSIEKRLDTLEGGKAHTGRDIQAQPKIDTRQSGEAKAQPAAVDRQEALYLREDVDEIFERLDVTEKKTLMDKINLGVALRTRVDNMYWEDDETGVGIHNDNFWSSRFRLRMGANLSRQLKFTGRMSVYKNWADADYSTMLWDANVSERPSDTTVRLDRAYVDLIFSDFFLPIAFTVGRQPTVGGVPGHFMDDTAARSTYPALHYEKETDAICMTIGLSKWTGWENSALRAMYGKFLQADNDRFIYLDDQGEDMDMLWLQGETRLPGAWHKTAAMLTYIRNWNMAGGPFEAITSQQGNLGYNEVYGVTLFSEDLYDFGLDWFFSLGHSRAHSSGNTIKADLNDDGVPETYGMLSSDGVGSQSGDSVYAGLKYRLPFAALNNAKIGIEYNQGSQYWWSPTIGSDDPFNKLATRGSAWEVYYLQPLLEHVLIRVGMLDIDHDYAQFGGAPIGEPMEVDQHLQTVYMLLDINF